MSERVQPKKVAWIPPEELDRSQGEYREVESHNEDGSTTFGRRVVWVDDAPSDNEDGSGHFEAYDGSDDDYSPIRR